MAAVPSSPQSGLKGKPLLRTRIFDPSSKQRPDSHTLNGVVVQPGVQRTHKPGTSKACSGTAWYYHAGVCVRLDKSTAASIRRLDPNIRVASLREEAHNLNKYNMLGLKESEWPSYDGRSLWPSYPTLMESLEMARKGITHVEPTIHGPFVRVSVSQIRDNLVLARQIVRRFIVGLRSDTEIPQQYWGYFRYSRGFCILTGKYSMPAGLVRFLLSRWCVDPTSLWLVRRGTLKQCLRAVPIGDLVTKIVDEYEPLPYSSED